MIKNKEPISLAEVREICKDKEANEKAKQLVSHTKQFVKIKLEDSLKLKQELQSLGLAKLKIAHIIKIIDAMPEDADDARKLFIDDISLDQDEISKILETVTKYKK